MQASWSARLAVIAMTVAAAAWSAQEDRVINVSPDDQAMTAAISKARETLSTFWSHFEARASGESDFSLKVRIEDKHGVEHFWVTNIKRDRAQIWGVIGNDPDIVKSVKIGDRIRVKEADISDWLYMRNGKMIGNFTVRPLLPRMSKEEASYIRGLLAEP